MQKPTKSKPTSSRRLKAIPVDSSVKAALGFKLDTDDAAVLKVWNAASTRVCKPCWELKYCPYGPLVEQFPLLPPTRESAQEHNNYLKSCLKSGTYGKDHKPLDAARRAAFKRMVAAFDPSEYPEKIPLEISDMSCRIFGHICPVVFSAEGFTETARQGVMDARTFRHTCFFVLPGVTTTCVNPAARRYRIIKLSLIIASPLQKEVAQKSTTCA